MLSLIFNVSLNTRTMLLHSVDWSKDCTTIYITNYNEHQVNIYEMGFEF